MKEIDGLAVIETAGIGVVVGVSFGEMRLGNVVNKGFCGSFPSLNCSIFEGVGFGKSCGEREYCCQKEER